MRSILTKKWVSILCSLALILALIPTTSVFASTTSAKVFIDNKEVKLTAQTKTTKNDLLVPFNEVAKKLGATVTHDTKKKMVTVKKGKTTAVVTVGSKTAKVNNKNVTLSQVPVYQNNQILVPYSFIGTTFNNWVSWNKTKNEVKIENTKTVKHEMGSITLKTPPQRVVVLFNGMVDISLTMGVKPVGAVESWIQKPWYNYISKQMVGVTSLGDENQPNLEEIVKLQPDLIIGSKLRHEAIYKQLDAIAPTIMTKDVQNWKKNMLAVAPALNKEDFAKEYLNQWNKDVKTLRTKLGNKINTEISIVRFMSDHARIYSRDSFPGIVLQDIGFKRPKVQQELVWGQKFTSKESIPAMNGDIIIDITSDYEGKGLVFKTRDEWQGHALWKTLTGVKNKKVYEVDDVMWNMSGGSMAARHMLDDLYKMFNVKK